MKHAWIILTYLYIGLLVENESQNLLISSFLLGNKSNLLREKYVAIFSTHIY